MKAYAPMGPRGHVCSGHILELLLDISAMSVHMGGTCRVQETRASVSLCCLRNERKALSWGLWFSFSHRFSMSHHELSCEVRGRSMEGERPSGLLDITGYR